jgi:hypothetical protein
MVSCHGRGRAVCEILYYAADRTAAVLVEETVLVCALRVLLLNPRFQPEIRVSLTTSQGLRRPPGVT